MQKKIILITLYKTLKWQCRLKKCAYVFFQLNGQVSWDLVTYFNKIQYDMHIDVGSYFLFHLKDMLWNKGFKKPKETELQR